MADPTKEPAFEKVVRHFLSTPPEPHDVPSKAKSKGEASKTRPASKGRVHKSKGRN